MSRSQKRKKIQSSHQSFFALLGSVCVKAEHKALVKSTPVYEVVCFLSTIYRILEMCLGLRCFLKEWSSTLEAWEPTKD